MTKLFSTSIPPLSPAFSYIENGSKKFITYTQFTSKLKELLDMAGYSPELFSGHSMRRGGATLLFQLGWTHCSFKQWETGEVTSF